MPGMWTFRSFIEADGTDVIEEWYVGATKQARSRFRSRLTILSQLSRNEWRRPLFDTLGEDCTGLWEMRFEANNVPWRPLGFFDGETAFTLVICASKNDNRWIPRNACALGLHRKALILADRSRCHGLPIPLE